jgi:hypothetical protein
MATKIYCVIDVSTFGGVNANNSYILKRSDQTGSWRAMNTTASGNVVTAIGDLFLNLQSDMILHR